LRPLLALRPLRTSALRPLLALRPLRTEENRGIIPIPDYSPQYKMVS
jgi:hypothetical protein